MTADDTWEIPPDPNRRRAPAIARAAQARLRELWSSLPPTAGAELRAAMVRLRRSRSPRQAVSALEHEIEHLFDNIAPTLVQHPLPVRTPAHAYATVTAIAGSAAAVEEMEAIALLLPGVNTAAAPTLPLVVAASFGALALEAYIAASLRVHMLETAGRAR